MTTTVASSSSGSRAAVGHSLRDRHGRRRRRGIVGFGEGALQAFHAEASAALNPPVSDAVGDEDETLAGLQLAIPRAGLACSAPTAPSGGCAGLLERFEVSGVVDHVPVRVAAVDPGQGGRGRAPPGHDRGNREIADCPAAGPFRPSHERASLEVARRCAGRLAGHRGRPPRDRRRWPGSGGVGDGKPGAVAVLDEVKPVSTHLVGGQERRPPAGRRRSARYAGKQVLLDLRGRGGGLSPPRRLDVTPCSRWPAPGPRRPAWRCRPAAPWVGPTTE